MAAPSSGPEKLSAEAAGGAGGAGGGRLGRGHFDEVDAAGAGRIVKRRLRGGGHDGPGVNSRVRGDVRKAHDPGDRGLPRLGGERRILGIDPAQNRIRLGSAGGE